MESSPEFVQCGGSYRRRSYSSGSEVCDHFISINERPVDDISIDLFYKPHTITLLLVTIIGLIYFCFTRDETASLQANNQVGIQAAVFFFLIISVLAFPNGPFTRPHPAIWRCVFGLSVLYMLLLIFILFQDYATVRGIFEWLFPELKNFTIDMDKGQWGENCDDLSLQHLWNSVDFFCFAHFFGWAMKTLLVRHYGILWTISVMWELTEMFFSHLLPNFIECWWDSLILDVILCNGFGIWFGMQFCHWMEMRYYSWESIKDISSTSGKLKRAVLQFTPEHWTKMRWLDPTSTGMRIIAVCQLVVFWQLSELNTFFLKHIFQMPPSHPLVFIRILLLGAISAPSIRQYYSYVTDPRCKRVGTQCWVYGLCMAIESIICVKFGQELFQRTQASNIIAWILVQMAGSVLCVYVCSRYPEWKKRRQTKARRARGCVTAATMVAEEDSAGSSQGEGGTSSRYSARKSVTLSTPDSDSTDRTVPPYDCTHMHHDDDNDDYAGLEKRMSAGRKATKGSSSRVSASLSYTRSLSGVLGDDEDEDDDDEKDEGNDGDDDSDSAALPMPPPLRRRRNVRTEM